MQSRFFLHPSRAPRREVPERFYFSLISRLLSNSCQPVYLTVLKRKLPTSHLSGLTDCLSLGGREPICMALASQARLARGNISIPRGTKCFISHLPASFHCPAVAPSPFNYRFTTIMSRSFPLARSFVHPRSWNTSCEVRDLPTVQKVHLPGGDAEK